MLSSIIHKNTDMHADQFAERYLFEPLGISSYVWHHTDDGLTNTGSGLELCPRDLAKIGYLYINNGIWKTQQILSESWIYESTRAWIQVDDDLHYGFQWWLLPLAGIPDIVPQNNDIYWAAGLYGQTIFAIPTLSMVVVINANEGNNYWSNILSILYDHILKAIQINQG